MSFKKVQVSGQNLWIDGHCQKRCFKSGFSMLHLGQAVSYGMDDVHFGVMCNRFMCISHRLVFITIQSVFVKTASKMHQAGFF